MAKSKKRGTKVPYAEIAQLLSQFAERADGLAAAQTKIKDSTDLSLFHAHENTNFLRKQVRDLQDLQKLQGDVNAAQKQTNVGTTDSLYALRDSTAKAFDGVSKDVKQMLVVTQKLNERLSKVESQNEILGTAFNISANRIAALETRVKVLEAYKTFVQSAFGQEQE